MAYNTFEMPQCVQLPGVFVCGLSGVVLHPKNPWTGYSQIFLRNHGLG